MRPSVLLSALLAGMLACASTLPSATIDANDSSASGQRRADNTSAPSDGVTILVDPGAEPHALLRYHPKVGDIVHWRTVMLMNTTMSLLGNSTQTEFGIEFLSQTEVVAVDESAQVHEYRTTFVDARLLSAISDPAVVEAALAPYMGLEQWIRTDSRGEEIESRYSRDGMPVDPRTIEGLDDTPSVALSFPMEPVGVGARWLEYDEIERNGFRVLQRSEHRLVGRNGDQLELESVVSQEPLSMTMHSDEMPPGTRVELRHFDARGGGKSIHSLELAVPIRVEARVEIDFGALIFADQQQSEMAVQMILQTGIERSE